MCPRNCWFCDDLGFRRTWGGDIVCPANCEAAVRWAALHGRDLWPPFSGEAPPAVGVPKETNQ